MKNYPSLFLLMLHFSSLSFVAFGGANSIVPELHRLFVQHYGWISNQHFLDIYSISQLSPGPNALISTLLGWQLQGIQGAVVSTLAFCAPACFIAYIISNFWIKYYHHQLLKIIKISLLPLTCGFMASTALIFIKNLEFSFITFSILIITAYLSYYNYFHPFWLLVISMTLSVLGFI